MTLAQNPGLQTSRRSLVRLAALTGAATVATGVSANFVAAQAQTALSLFPEDYHYPTVTGPSLALWGSSSFDGAHADQGVPQGYNASLAHLLRDYLEIPVLEFGRGGDTSTMIAARRGVGARTYQLVFPQDKIPATGSVPVTLAEGSQVAWGPSAQVPGLVGDVPGVLTAGDTEGSYSFTRTLDGAEVYAPASSPASWFHSYQEMVSRACYHVIQIGRNNLDEFEQIKEDTQLSYDLAPERTLVMGHFRGQWDARDSAMAKQVEAYNAWAEGVYGDRFVNPELFMRETTQEAWLRYGALSGSGVWASDEDRAAYDEGKIPPSFYAADGFHLNGWGYVALAQQLYYRTTHLGWFEAK